MHTKPKVALPYEADATAHRALAERREQTRRWLEERERQLQELESPGIVPSESDMQAGPRLDPVGSR